MEQKLRNIGIENPETEEMAYEEKFLEFFEDFARMLP